MYRDADEKFGGSLVDALQPLPGPRKVDFNRFLSLLMARLRRSRVPISAAEPWSVTMERERGGILARVWFLTKGCSWDARGACTMCNYGSGPALSVDSMIRNVREGLRPIDSDTFRLFLAPSGSLLDPHEVPTAALVKICELANRAPGDEFITETRPETIDDVSLDLLLGGLPEKRVSIGMGLETSDSWVQRFCVNKMTPPRSFAAAAHLLKARSIGVHMNVCLGTAFLSTREAVLDSERSARWALRNGADLVIVFPLHVRPFTLLAHLWERGRYRPPSLWSLVEVLHRLGPAFAGRVQISWHRDYSSGDSTIASPTTCPQCVGRVLRLLDRFRDEEDFSHVETMRSIDCPCRVQWMRDFDREPAVDRRRRVQEEYRMLARSFELEDEWRTVCAELEEEDIPSQSLAG